jgi:GNAT superfamily N-acetyltransferase
LSQSLRSLSDTAAEAVFRPIARGDRKLWEPLWLGYQEFYERTASNELTEFAWKCLTATHEIGGFLALTPDGEALGLVHFFHHPSTGHRGGNCYLQDLFVIPTARGRRISRRLIAAVVEAAKGERSRGGLLAN